MNREADDLAEAQEYALSLVAERLRKAGYEVIIAEKAEAEDGFTGAHNARETRDRLARYHAALTR